MNLQIKKLVAIVLIVAMIIISTGFASLADSIDDVTNAISNEEQASSSKYYDEMLKESKDESTTVIKVEEEESTIIEEPEGDNEATEVTEPEEDEATTIEEIEGGTTTIVEEIENDETTAVEEDETTTKIIENTSSKIIVDEEDTATGSEIIEEILIGDMSDGVTTLNIETNLASDSEAREGTSPLIGESSANLLGLEPATFSELEEIPAENGTPLFGDTPLFGAAPSTIWLGTYPQNDTTGVQKEPIKWRKLSESGTEALYISDQVLYTKGFHNTHEEVTWADSDIHSWLNGDFANYAFTSNQLNNSSGIIKTKTITTSGSADTNDKLFLLSSDEANSLFSNNDDRIANWTPYAQKIVDEYWLRSPSSMFIGKYIVDWQGRVAQAAGMNSDRGIRPALYINLVSLLYKSSNNTVSWNHNGGILKADSTLWNSYTTYLGGQQLPVANNYTAPTGKYFLGMSVDYPKKLQKYINIPDDQTENITITALWGDTTNDKVVNYDFGDGSCIDWSMLPRIYTPGTSKSIPSKEDFVNFMTVPLGKKFLGFRKSGTYEIITEIPATETEDIVLKAVFESPAIFKQGWWNSTTDKSVIQNINVDEYRTVEDTYWDEIFEMNLTDFTYAYRKGNTINVYGYGDSVKAVGNISEIFKDFPNLQSMDLSGVDFSEATNMEGLFKNCSSLTSVYFDTAATTSNVTNISKMFENCSNLTNITLPTDFGSNATNFEKIFSGCSELTTLNLTNINTSNVTGTGLNNMFDGCEKLTTLTLGDNFKTNTATELKYMFNNCKALTTLTLPTNFTATNVTDMRNMFASCSELTSLSLPNDFDTSLAINMSNMFNGCEKLATLSNLKITAVTDASSMFKNCKELTSIDFKDSSFANLTNAVSMFENCNALTEIKVNTDVRNLPAIASTTNMFLGCTDLAGSGGYKFNANYIDGEFARVDYGGILPGYFSLTDDSIYAAVHLDINKTWDDNITKSNILKIVFSTASTIESYENEFPLNLIDTTLNAKGYLKDGGTTLMVHMAPKIRHLYAGVDWSEFFADFTNLLSIENLANVFDTSAVTDISRLFRNCKNLKNVNIKNLNTSHVTNMNGLFDGCEKFGAGAFTNGLFGAGSNDLNIIDFDTSAATDMGNMFKNCKGFTEILFGENFKTNNVATMSSMFENCENLKSINVASLSVTNVSNMSGMFKNCKNLTELDLIDFETNALTNTSEMFKDCTKLKTIYATTSFTTALVTNDTDMFSNNPVLVGCKGTAYSVKLVKDKSYAIVDEGPNSANPGYFTFGKPYSPPSPTPSPSPRRGGGGISGGGGGGRGGGGIMQELERSVNFVMRTPIYEHEYTWIYDNSGQRIGINLSVDSIVGKAMIHSVKTKGAYALNQDGKTIQIGGGGIYKIYYRGKEEWFGFDKWNRMMTGFVETSAKTKLLTIDMNSIVALANTNNVGEEKIFIEEAGEIAKYYLYENYGDVRGQLWNKPIVVQGIQYTFDTTGKVISSADSIIDQGIWEYNPVEDCWRYFAPDTDGKVTYYKDTSFNVYYKGETYKYIFDAQGNLLTGYFNWHGKSYYGLESGQYKGAAMEVS